MHGMIERAKAIIIAQKWIRAALQQQQRRLKVSK